MREAKALAQPFLPVKEILRDYLLACESREASLLGRKEVFKGKAKFGIFGDGKEVAQIAMAKAFQKGDFRSGYYRDQTFMMAIGGLTLKQYFAQLYAHTDIVAEPASAGRMMNSHFGNRLIDENGEWKDQTQMKNSSSDISCTAGQMPRLVGLGYASKLYRNNPELKKFTKFSKNGNEVAFGTIGNASTSEGQFFESMNAIGVLQIPVVMSVWDDDYGISVPKEYHTTKESISKALEGLQRTDVEKGFDIFTVKGWNYERLCRMYKGAAKLAREEHVPVLVHVTEMTQPQGHSTSGSHERYKSKDRLEWEKEFDCIKQFKLWILKHELASEDHLNQLETDAKANVKQAMAEAWKEFMAPIEDDRSAALQLLEQAINQNSDASELKTIHSDLKSAMNPLKMDIHKALRRSLRHLLSRKTQARDNIIQFLKEKKGDAFDQYSSHLYNESSSCALKQEGTPAKYSDDSKIVDAREVLQACFEAAFKRDPRFFTIGEDVGNIGDVNQGMAGMQEKFGEIRVTDTGIRETSIVGQGIGAAIRGLRPIAEVQYLDYLIFALQTLSDDLATIQYRTKGGQKAPVIIRTRGHRLEGIWHSGSPMQMILGSLRGLHILVPRNMTQAAGLYNTIFASDDAALMIESLNGYRLKERIPDNIGDFKVPLGIPEILKEGSDLTIVTYGSMCRLVLEAANQLEANGISVEVIDVQTLIPFDRQNVIIESLKKTNKVIFADEDVPGGGSAYMMQKVLEDQNAYAFLDAKPRTLSAKAHRPAYGSDGDYFSKPGVEDVFEAAYEIMSDYNPLQFPALY
ncbi:MAG: thiamine pyrophosphate-dependent enzyme [Cyclobacteriaceae bacterium]